MDIFAIIKNVHQMCNSFIQLDPPIVNITEYLQIQSRLQDMKKDCRSLIARANIWMEKLRSRRGSFALFPRELIHLTLTWVPFRVAIALVPVCKAWYRHIQMDRGMLYSKWFGNTPKELCSIQLSRIIRDTVHDLRGQPRILHFGSSPNHIDLWDGPSYHCVSFLESDKTHPVVVDNMKMGILDQDVGFLSEADGEFFAGRMVKFREREYIHFSKKDKVIQSNLVSASAHYHVDVAFVAKVQCDEYIDVDLLNWTNDEYEIGEREVPGLVQNPGDFTFRKVGVSQEGDVVTLVDRNSGYDGEYAYLVLWKEGEGMNFLLPLPSRTITCLAVNKVLISVCCYKAIYFYTHTGKLWKILSLPWNATEMIMTDELLTCYRRKAIRVYRFVY